MLGRHIYRVHRTAQGWTVTKEGENQRKVDFSVGKRRSQKPCGWLAPTSPPRSRSTTAMGLSLKNGCSVPMASKS